MPQHIYAFSHQRWIHVFLKTFCHVVGEKYFFIFVFCNNFYIKWKIIKKKISLKMLPYRDNCVKILVLSLLKIYNAYIHMILKNKLTIQYMPFFTNSIFCLECLMRKWCSIVCISQFPHCWIFIVNNFKCWIFLILFCYYTMVLWWAPLYRALVTCQLFC